MIKALKVGWSFAELKWHDKTSYAMRWNGGTKASSPLGNPQSRGIATWFILPLLVGKLLLEKLKKDGSQDENN